MPPVPQQEHPTTADCCLQCDLGQYARFAGTWQPLQKEQIRRANGSRDGLLLQRVQFGVEK